MQSFEEFLATQSSQIPILEFLINLLLAALLSFLLGKFYIRYGDSLSNRRSLANNFMLITLTTTLIITVVKSSLALSLGLVGALSIVRFRAAIKEPEELAYLFLSIAIGLGFGANQKVITIVAFGTILLLYGFRHFFRSVKTRENLFVNISMGSENGVTIEKIINQLSEHCSVIDLKRVDQSNHTLEACFYVEYLNTHELAKSIESIKSISSSANITVLENKGITS